MKKKDCIMVFLKYPRKGEVKTRLAETVGHEIATDIYKNLCEITFEQCLLLQKNEAVDILLFCASDKDIGKVNEWTNNNFISKSQSGDNLGVRLHNAFEHVFYEGYNKCVVIGTDAPEISANIIEQAFIALDNNDYVIGEAQDGGYYLLGMKEYNPKIFEEISWSTNTVYKRTTEIIYSLNKTVFNLPILIDIDREEDLLQLQNSNEVLYARLLE